jgi:hypothetical protein
MYGIRVAAAIPAAAAAAAKPDLPAALLSCSNLQMVHTMHVPAASNDIWYC